MPEAIENIDAIIKVTDGVMVARGDLGVEIPMEEVPLVQKMIVKKCIDNCRPVIIATQMMESMINTPGHPVPKLIIVTNQCTAGRIRLWPTTQQRRGQTRRWRVRTRKKQRQR